MQDADVRFNSILQSKRGCLICLNEAAPFIKGSRAIHGEGTQLDAEIGGDAQLDVELVT